MQESYGLNTVLNDRDSDTPDARNGVIGRFGRRWGTRAGGLKDNVLTQGSPIYSMVDLKSGFCKENYFIVRLGNGELIEGYDPFSGYTAITNCVELQAMQNDLAGEYYLANDIDCTYCTQDSAGALYNGGAGFAPISTFTGTLDGRGYTITGLKVNRPTQNYIGLFGYVNGATIKNVGMINVDVSGRRFGTGGFIGTLQDGTVTNCYSTGSVDTGGSGGLVGIMSGGTVTNCYSTCAVSGSYSYSGGFIGTLQDGTVTNCYSTGLVSGSDFANKGFIGQASGGTVTNCFWDTETSGKASSAGGTGKTTAEMKQQATFTNWDFSTIWDITETITYPWLR